MEYAVMKQIGTEEPEVYQAGFTDHDKAYSAVIKAEHSVDDLLYNGIVVRTVAEAERSVEEIKIARLTRFYVARREVADWEEAY